MMPERGAVRRSLPCAAKSRTQNVVDPAKCWFLGVIAAGLNSEGRCSTKTSSFVIQIVRNQKFNYSGKVVLALLEIPTVEHIDRASASRFDLRSSRPCEFCRDLDPQFHHRRPLDQMIACSRLAVASAHLTEDGYVRHRMMELARRAPTETLVAA